MSLAVCCSTCGTSILVENAVYVGEKAVFCKDHEPCNGCWARRYGPHLNCMANDKFRETCHLSQFKEESDIYRVVEETANDNSIN